jgi:hypothetical protein
MRLRHVATVGPRPHGFGVNATGDEMSFLPLDRIWPDERFDASGVVPYTGNGSYNPVNEGDILLPKVSPTFAHGRCAVARDLVGGRALATSEVFVIRAHDPRDATFISFCLREPTFLDNGTGAWAGVAGLKRVSIDFVRNVWIDDAVWLRRRAVSVFLQEQLIGINQLHAAHRRALRAASSAAREYCSEPFGRNGIAALDCRSGQRLRFLVREVDERARLQALPMLSVTLDRGVIRRDQLTSDPPSATDVSGYKVARAGDIVVNRMRAFQGAVGVAPEDGVVSPDYLVLRGAGDATPPLIARALASSYGASAMAARVRGIGGVSNGAVRTPRINSADLLDVRMLVPDAAGQNDVVARIERTASALAVLRSRADEVSAALHTYRDSLIHEAVTGKLDVTRASDAQMDERLHAAVEGRLDEVRV